MSIKMTVVQVCEEVDLSQDRVTHFIEEEWIVPSIENELDEEDIARIRLIKELKDEFEVNDEGIPIILRLIDQLNCLRVEIKRTDYGKGTSKGPLRI